MITDPSEILLFLFQLSYCQVGKGYPLIALTERQRTLVDEFSKLGIVYHLSPHSTHFYPSQVAVDLIFRGSASSLPLEVPSSSVGVTQEDRVSRLDIIVETNFQVSLILSFCSIPLTGVYFVV